MKIDDKKLKKLLSGKAGARPRGRCPDEERLAAFSEGRLSEADETEVVGHIARCGPCANAVLSLRTILSEPEKEGAAKLPLSLIERARKLDPSGKGIMDVVVEFAKGAARLVKSSGDVVGGMVPATDAVRGGEGQVISENLVTLTKEFPPYSAEVDVEKVRDNTAEISIKLLDKESGSPAKGLRVSLFKEESELESTMLDAGFAVFQDLAFGHYRLDVTRVGEPVGRITLEMKGEGK